MLALFDIDRTLLKTDGAGRNSMTDAGAKAFGPGFTREGVQFSGCIDPNIIRDLLVRNEIEPTDEHRTRLRDAYAAELGKNADGRIAPLPGGPELVDAVAERGATLAILTGNFEETGRLKLAAAGYDPDRFEIHVWGDDSPHPEPLRDHLPPVAMERYAALKGSPVDPAAVTVIGDTVHDVRCAVANGCRCLAVATGNFSAAELAEAGAHRVAHDLTHTEDLAAWVTASAMRG